MGARPESARQWEDIAEGKGVHREVESEGSWIWGIYDPMGKSLV